MNGLQTSDGGVVDDDVEPAQLLGRLVDEPPALVRVPQVRGHPDRGLRQLGGVDVRAAPGRGDLRPAEVGLGDERPAEPAGGSGDEDT